jgi:hypothetical protein
MGFKSPFECSFVFMELNEWREIIPFVTCMLKWEKGLNKEFGILQKLPRQKIATVGTGT